MALQLLFPAVVHVMPCYPLAWQKGYFDKVRVCRKCFPDQYAEAAKKSDLMFEASAGQRRREFERRKAAERKANRDTRREEIRLKYARASDH